jgi:hypothetical protein
LRLLRLPATAQNNKAVARRAIVKRNALKTANVVLIVRRKVANRKVALAAASNQNLAMKKGEGNLPFFIYTYLFFRATLPSW